MLHDRKQLVTENEHQSGSPYGCTELFYSNVNQPLRKLYLAHRTIVSVSCGGVHCVAVTRS